MQDADNNKTLVQACGIHEMSVIDPQRPATLAQPGRLAMLFGVPFRLALTVLNPRSKIVSKRGLIRSSRYRGLTRLR